MLRAHLGNLLGGPSADICIYNEELGSLFAVLSVGG